MHAASFSIAEIGESRVAAFYTCLLAHLAGKAPERRHGFEVGNYPSHRFAFVEDSLIILLCIWQQNSSTPFFYKRVSYLVRLGSTHTLYLVSHTLYLAMSDHLHVYFAREWWNCTTQQFLQFLWTLCCRKHLQQVILEPLQSSRYSSARLYLVACSLSICHRPTYNGELLVINLLEGSGISSWAPCWWRFLVQPILTFIGWMMTCMVWKFLSQKLATCSICVGVNARWWLWWWCTCMVHEIQNCNSHSGWLYMVTHQSVFCTILGANLEILLKGSCII